MNARKMYWRKKGKSIVLEGRMANGKPLLIWTLPEPNKFISMITENASFLPLEKQQQIREKFTRLDFAESKKRKRRREVRLLTINRTPNKDAVTEDKSKELLRL